VFASTDHGASWRPVGQGLTDFVIRALTVSGTSLFAGTAGGVFASSDGGARWNKVNDGLTSVNVLALTVIGMNIFAGTLGAGVWQRTLAEMVTSSQESSGPIPGSFELCQNYPNPFNPSTTIRYALPERSHVTLTIFNTLGEVVANLVGGEQEAGYHEVVFDASGLSSGVYFYRLRAKDVVQTKRLAVLR
jgi:hypothetical protein